MAPKTYTYKTVEECDIKADLYRPTQASGVTPVIVYIHGGCLMSGSRNIINKQQAELYLQAGFSVISLDYRLAPESKLPAIIDDLKDFFIWLKESANELHIDPERIGVVGHSAGGYLALMSGFCVTPQPQAIVALYGYGDITGQWYTQPDPFYCQQATVSEEESEIHTLPKRIISEPYEGRLKNHKLYLYYRQNGLWTQEVGGVDPTHDKSFYTPYCPLKNVSNQYPPTLLLHGNNDTDVPYEQSQMMADTFARHDVSHQLITIQNGRHGFDSDMDDPTVQAAFSDIINFFSQL